jgi:alpha-mannosidase
MVFRRLDRFVARYLLPNQYSQKVPLDILGWKVGGEPVDFAAAKSAPYERVEIGQPWGSPWDTWWFQVEGTVPQEWSSELENHQPELLVDLGKKDYIMPGFQAEALVRDEDGTIIKAVEPWNSRVPLPDCGQDFHYYIEAAANPRLFVNPPEFTTPFGKKGVSTGPELYKVGKIEISLLDLRVWNLIQELEVLEGLVKELDPSRTRYANIMASFEDAMNVMDPADIPGTAQAARDCLKEVLSQPAPKDSHSIFSIGHAHIDTIWLWPERETKRKVARTFSNVLELMEEYPDFKFAASSAQQYKWLKEKYPELFDRVKEKVKSGDFIPVGGMWVESDINMPSGESLARQFLYATRFFEKEFGTSSKIAWLPDSFGYSGAFPQIAKLAGCDYFLTQKMSWNDTNTFPHNSFIWEGIDGSELFAHFPPSDTYGSQVSPRDVALSEKRYKEKGKGNTSILLFGYGDGGGGPTREMMKRIDLQKNLEGSPTIQIASPEEFFEKAQAELKDPPRWVGELYLEMHRGTSTTQAKTKQGNRRMESLLREAELWSAHAALSSDFEYPYDALQDMWQNTLLYQFHDVLPGSAMEWVYEDAEEAYRKMEIDAEAIIHSAIASLVGDGNMRLEANSSPFAQAGVAPLAIAPAEEPSAKVEKNADGTISLSNANVAYVLSEEGKIISAVDLRSGKESIDPNLPGNDLQLFRDVPSQWEAWDIQDTYMKMPLPGAEVKDIDVDSDGVVRVSGLLGSSAYEQTITLDMDVDALKIHTHVDWHESDKVLKQAFPVKDFSASALSEIQYGHIERPTHTNTSWDEARYETVAHRWVFVGDKEHGVGLANDSKYGHDIREIKMSDGRPGIGMRVSLLRAVHWPMPDADIAEQDSTVSFGVGKSVKETIRQGYRLNVPARAVSGARAITPLMSVDAEGVLVESVKLAEDRSGDLIVRVYESLGTGEQGSVKLDRPWKSVQEVGLIEVDNPNVPKSIVEAQPGEVVKLALHSFQVVTLRFKF